MTNLHKNKEYENIHSIYGSTSRFYDLHNMSIRCSIALNDDNLISECTLLTMVNEARPVGVRKITANQFKKGSTIYYDEYHHCGDGTENFYKKERIEKLDLSQLAVSIDVQRIQLKEDKERKKAERAKRISYWNYYKNATIEVGTWTGSRRKWELVTDIYTGLLTTNSEIVYMTLSNGRQHQFNFKHKHTYIIEQGFEIDKNVFENGIIEIKEKAKRDKKNARRRELYRLKKEAKQRANQKIKDEQEYQVGIKAFQARYDDEKNVVDVLTAFFKEEIHPAPAVVYSFKKGTGLSWNELRFRYKKLS